MPSAPIHTVFAASLALTLLSPTGAISQQLTQQQAAVARVLQHNGLNDVDVRTLSSRQLRVIQARFGNETHATASSRPVIERIIAPEDFAADGNDVPIHMRDNLERQLTSSGYGAIDLDRLSHAQIVEISTLFENRSSESNRNARIRTILERAGYRFSEAPNPTRTRFIRQSFNGTALANFDVDSLSAEQQRFVAVQLHGDTINSLRMPRIIRYLQSEGVLSVR